RSRDLARLHVRPIGAAVEVVAQAEVVAELVDRRLEDDGLEDARRVLGVRLVGERLRAAGAGLAAPSAAPDDVDRVQIAEGVDAALLQEKILLVLELLVHAPPAAHRFDELRVLLQAWLAVRSVRPERILVEQDALEHLAI